MEVPDRWATSRREAPTYSARPRFAISSKPKSAKDLPKLRLVLEGAAGIPYTPLQDRLIDYSTSGPEELRTLAAAAVSDPSTVTLPGTQELVQPLVDQIMRGAQDYDRRQTLAQPVLKLFSRATVERSQNNRAATSALLVPGSQIREGARCAECGRNQSCGRACHSAHGTA